jgi:hypothetical protein
MKPYSLLSAIAAILLIFQSCRKNPEPVILPATSPDSMYLVRFPGFVQNPENRYYKLINGVVIADTARKMHTQPSNYNYVLPAKNNAIAKTLFDIPQQMFANNGKFYENGMITDCGGYSITTFRNGVKYEWIIEDCYNKPDSITAYVQKLTDACIEFEK